MTIVVIGGGVVGLSLALGLLERGRKVIVLDGSDEEFRASRGNFGLIWVQGKGATSPAYAWWTRNSAGLWPVFAEDLRRLSGVDLALHQTGGLEYCTSDGELEERAAMLARLRQDMDGEYPFEVLDHAALKRLVPEIGPKVVGGTFSPMDGHVNPLFLLQALGKAVRVLGGEILPGARVVDLVMADHDFTAILADGKRIAGEGLVLAAGLGAKDFASRLGFEAPIRPQQGQILITEKLPPFLKYPSGTIRQVNEGGVQIGASKAEVGFDDNEDPATIAGLARHAVDVFPHLARVKVIRSWAALRIMSPDGLPIYERSARYRGASFVTCHSGITLAAAHVRLLPDWILGRDTATDFRHFNERRFDVPAA